MIAHKEPERPAPAIAALAETARAAFESRLAEGDGAPREKIDKDRRQMERS